MLGVQLVELGQVDLLPVHALGDSHAGYVLLEAGVHAGNGVANAHEGSPSADLPEDHYDHENGHDNKAEQGQVHVPVHHYQNDQDQAQHLSEAHHKYGHELLEGRGVVLDATHQPPHLVMVEELGGESLEMGVHVAAQLVQHRHVDPGQTAQVDEVPHQVEDDYPGEHQANPVQP